MKKIILSISLFLLFYCISSSQKISGRLNFQQGQVVEVEMILKTTIAQQAMGQAIDFNVEANAIHNYKVTNSTEDNTTLHHQVKKISFTFDGMGQKRSFDSEKEKDMNGAFGKSIKELLDKKYDIIVDTAGKVLVAMPEKVELKEEDSRMAVINSMLKGIIDLVQPPSKGNPSFFQVLPPGGAGINDAWTINSTKNGGKSETAFKVSDINDSTIVVDFIEKSITVTKANMMGNETTTTMNNKSTGKIILDRATGIMKEKNSTTESNGSTEGPFGTMPVTSKTSAVLKINSR